MRSPDDGAARGAEHRQTIEAPTTPPPTITISACPRSSLVMREISFAGRGTPTLHGAPRVAQEWRVALTRRWLPARFSANLLAGSSGLSTRATNALPTRIAFIS